MRLAFSMFLLCWFSSMMWLSASMGVPADAVDQPFVEEYLQQQSEQLTHAAPAVAVVDHAAAALHEGNAAAASSSSSSGSSGASHDASIKAAELAAAAGNGSPASAGAGAGVSAPHVQAKQHQHSSSSSGSLEGGAAGGSGASNSTFKKSKETDNGEAGTAFSVYSMLDMETQRLYKTFGDRWLTVFGLCLYFFLYFAFATIYFVLEHFRMWPQWRIQPGFWASSADYKNVIIHLLRMFFFGLLPAAWMGAPYLAMIGITANRALPDLQTFALQMFAFWVIEDIFQYFLHRFLHTKWMYKRIHKQHHDYQVPFAFAATYAHPVEIAILGFCSFAGPVMFRPHLFVMVAWMIVQQTDACIRHSGYDFPFDPLNWLPLYGGPKFHDAHHEVFMHNYASRFVALDMAFGTYKDPVDLIAKHREKEAKMMAKRAAAKVE